MPSSKAPEAAAVPPPAGKQQEQLQQEQAQKPIHDKEEFFKGDAAGISGAPAPPGQRLVKREERIEYRDQDGNILNEEQVKSLEGKVEFKTRYETRTRMVDADGNEFEAPLGGEAGEPVAVAPPHPDVEGVDTQTAQKQKAAGEEEVVPPAKESVEGDHEAKAKAAKPASEKKEASKEASSASS